IFGETLTRMAEQDEKIVAITSAMPDGTGLTGFQARHPDRFYDACIAEHHAVSFGSGLACGGMKPFVAIYSTFLQRAYDQIIHDVAIQKLPVRFCIDRAGLVGADGETHQGAFDMAYLRCIPNMVVMAPKDEKEFARMLETARQYEEGPIALRYPRGAGVGAVPDPAPEPLPIGRGELLRPGADVAIIAIGSMVHPALAAAEQLAAGGIDAAVVNARFVKPLDEELLLDVIGRADCVVTVEEGARQGG